MTFDKDRGSYVGRITTGHDEQGRPVRSKFRGRTRAEVVGRMNAARRALDAGLEVPNERLTVGQWMTRWLDTLPGTVSPGSEDTYRRVVRLYIRPAIGYVKLAKLSPTHVDKLLRDMERGEHPGRDKSKPTHGLSGETRRLTRAVLRRALRRAEQEGLVGRNVAAIADGPRIERSEQRAMSTDEATALIAAAGRERLGAAIVLALAVGLRRGETLGLTWGAVDLEGDRPTARIEQQLIRWQGENGRRGVCLADVKTAKSRRTVVLPGFVVAALRRHRAKQAEERLAVGTAWSDEAGLVFTTPIGTPVDPRNFNRVVASVAKAAGLGHWHPHELRHSAVSLLLAQGVPLEVVSEVVGHSSIRVTKDVYGHMVDGQRAQAADAMQKAFGSR